MNSLIDKFNNLPKFDNVVLEAELKNDYCVYITTSDNVTYDLIKSKCFGVETSPKQTGMYTCMIDTTNLYKAIEIVEDYHTSENNLETYAVIYKLDKLSQFSSAKAIKVNGKMYQPRLLIYHDSSAFYKFVTIISEDDKHITMRVKATRKNLEREHENGSIVMFVQTN